MSNLQDGDVRPSRRIGGRAAWLKIAFSAALLGWLLSGMDVAAIGTALSRLSAPVVATVVAVVALQHVVLAWRWQRIVRWLGGDWSLKDSLKWLFIGLFLNQALPTGIGGDAARMWALHRHGHSASISMGSVIAERGTGLAVLCLLIAIAVLAGPASLSGSKLGQVLVLCALGVLALLATLVVADRWLTLWLPKRIAEPCNRLAQAVRAVCRSGRMLFEIVATGAVAAALGLYAGVVLGGALGLQHPPTVYVALIGATVLLTLVPVSLGGWGVREAGMVALFGQLGTPAEPVLALSVLWGVLPLIVAVPGGLILWIGSARGATAIPHSTANGDNERQTS